MAKYPERPKRTRFKSLKDAVERILSNRERDKDPIQNVNSHGFRTLTGGAGGGGAGAGGDQGGVSGGEAVNTDSGVSGPASSTDNAWPRWDGTDGLTLQDGDWVEDDSGNVTAGGNLDINGNSVEKSDYYGYTNQASGPTPSAGYAAAWVRDSDGDFIVTYNTGGGAASVNLTDKMDNFAVTADSGTNQTIGDGQTLDIEGGTGISTVVGATNKITINAVASGLGVAFAQTFPMAVAKIESAEHHLPHWESAKYPSSASAAASVTDTTVFTMSIASTDSLATASEAYAKWTWNSTSSLGSKVGVMVGPIRRCSDTLTIRARMFYNGAWGANSFHKIYIGVSDNTGSSASSDVIGSMTANTWSEEEYASIDVSSYDDHVFLLLTAQNTTNLAVYSGSCDFRAEYIQAVWA